MLVRKDLCDVQQLMALFDLSLWSAVENELTQLIGFFFLRDLQVNVEVEIGSCRFNADDDPSATAVELQNGVALWFRKLLEEAKR